MTEHPMTDATPLASEQITQEDDCPYCAGTEEVRATLADGTEDYIPCPHPCHRIAALSATPAPSDQDASQAQGEVERIARAFCLTFNEKPNAIVTAGDPVGNPVDVEMWQLWQPEARKFLAALSPAPGATAQDGVERITAEKLGEIMQEEWGDICDDAQAHPLDMKHGRGTVLFYQPNHWTSQIAAALNRYLSASPTPTIPAGMVAFPEGAKPLVYSSALAKFADNETTEPCGYEIWVHTTSPVLPTMDAAYEWAKQYVAAAAPKQAEQQGVEALVQELRPLVDAAAGPNGWDWMFPLRVQPVDGKPTIVSHKGGNLFRGYIGTWQEADLLVALANAAPRILAALNAPTGAVEKGEAK